MLPLLIAVAQGPRLPPPTVPSGWGVNIHFTDERPGEVAKIAGAFRWVRMDFMWHATERERGKYDFAAYDRLLAALDRSKVRPYFILDYGNDLYGEGSPRTPESRAAFCRWVAAAMIHYKGRGILWEMWNEPNIAFWKPKPDVREYVALAREVGQTIRRVAPREVYVGPATSGFDWPFLQACLDAGLLEYWDAVSVHPYRQNEPESVVDDWLRLRAMLDRAAPGRNVPMISGEWGYSELYSGQTKEKQGQYIVRQYLANLSCGVPISIFYDWKDDGTDPKETEHHFGTVLPDLSPKPAYLAAQRLSRDLAGFSYVTRLWARDERQWMLLFRREKEARVVAWTTGEPSTATLPGFRFQLRTTPRVVQGPTLAPLLALRPEPWYAMVDGPTPEYGGLVLENDVQEAYQRVGKTQVVQRTRIVPRRPLGVTMVPGRDGKVRLRIENPLGRKLGGLNVRFKVVREAEIEAFRGWGAKLRPVKKRGLKGVTLLKAPAREGETIVPEGARFVQIDAGNDFDAVFYTIPRFVPLSLEGATAAAEGDGKIRANVSATPGPDGTRLEYDFDAGWRFAELRLPPKKAGGKPKELGMWVEGNGSGDLLRMRYTDATGQTFQPDAGPLDWKGWRYVSVKLDGSGGHWGGANDGVVRYPISVTTVALVDMPGGRGGKGSITVTRPVLAYSR